MDEKRNTLLECKDALEEIKTHEFKNRVEGEELGVHYANRASTLHSPQKGVPIREDTRRGREIIRLLEKKLGLTSWIDNI